MWRSLLACGFKDLLRLDRLLAPPHFAERARKFFSSAIFLLTDRPRKTFIIYVNRSRHSAWPSEVADSLNCSGQFAVGFPGDSAAGASQKPGTFTVSEWIG